MKSRLGFSISLALDPDIFIVDEALSVGDKGFAKKCLDRMKQLRDEKDKTILFISHSLPQVRGFCKSGIWIEGGRLVETGPIDEVCDHYSDYVDKLNALSAKEKKKLLDEKFKERLIVSEKKSFWQKIYLARWGRLDFPLQSLANFDIMLQVYYENVISEIWWLINEKAFA